MFGKELCGDLVETLAAQLEGHFGRELDAIGHMGHGGRATFLFRLRAVVKYGTLFQGGPLGRQS
ncbi:hypothetical protein D3C76_459420 [compost metagenome]